LNQFVVVFVSRWAYRKIVILHFILPRNGFAYLVKEVPNVWINGERFGLVRQNIKFANVLKNPSSQMHDVESRRFNRYIFSHFGYSWNRQQQNSGNGISLNSCFCVKWEVFV